MERENEVFFAKLASKAERYAEVVKSIKKVCELDANLSLDERNLLAEGYDNILNASRRSWNAIRKIEDAEKHKNEGETEDLRRIREYRLMVEAEFKEICKDCINLIDTYLIPLPNPPEAVLFFKKMKGDYYRYLAWIKSGDEKIKDAEQSKKAYEDAKMVADANFPATNPARLFLEHNFSVLYYDIFNDATTAYRMAKAAYDGAASDMVVLSDQDESRIAVMDELMENITNWAEEIANRDVLILTEACEEEPTK